MRAMSTVSIAKTKVDIGTPDDYSRDQLDVVKAMIKQVADDTTGGMKNIVKAGDKVMIKINTVIPSPPENGFTTDPRMLEALIELVMEQGPGVVQIGERSALGGDTKAAMDVCGITAVAERTGAELLPFDDAPFDTYTVENPPSNIFNEFPVPRAVKEADVYIGLPKMKVHVHTEITCALKLQFGNLPDYDWMTRNHRDDIYQKIVNLTRAANPTWFIVDSLYACQGNGPFSAYPEDLVRDFNTIFGGSDPVAVDTICEAIMGWETPGLVQSTVLAAAQGLGTNKMDEIELLGVPLEEAVRPFRKRDITLEGAFPNVNIIRGSACEAGCRVLVRMALDAVYADGTLAKLKEPLNIFTGLVFEPMPKDLKGPVVVYGDCAKPMLKHYANAAYWGSTDQYPNCTPIWSNVPKIGLADHIRSLVNGGAA